MSSNKKQLSEYMLENMDCVICKRTDIPKHKLHWNNYGSYTDTCEKCFIKQTKANNIEFIIVDVIEFRKQIRFPDDIWNLIKSFAGYSNNYPTDLPYYVRMLGMTGNYSMTNMRWKRVKSLEDYIDKLCEICDDLEEELIFKFAPKPKPKSWDQMRIEWDAKYGAGSFDDDDLYF